MADPNDKKPRRGRDRGGRGNYQDPRDYGDDSRYYSEWLPGHTLPVERPPGSQQIGSPMVDDSFPDTRRETPRSVPQVPTGIHRAYPDRDNGNDASTTRGDMALYGQFSPDRRQTSDSRPHSAASPQHGWTQPWPNQQTSGRAPRTRVVSGHSDREEDARYVPQNVPSIDPKLSGNRGYNHEGHAGYAPQDARFANSRPTGNGGYNGEGNAGYGQRTAPSTRSSAAPTPTPTREQFIAPPPPIQIPLGDRYQVQANPRGYFRKGTVFALLWHEAAGNIPAGDDQSFSVTNWGEPVYSAVKRMVVYREDRNYCNCLQIHTYRGQGFTKPFLTLRTHASVLLVGAQYTGPPIPRTMIQSTFRVRPNDSREKLDKKSLINFGAHSTVQHNWKVRPIGTLIPESLDLLIYYYQQCAMLDGTGQTASYR